MSCHNSALPPPPIYEHERTVFGEMVHLCAYRGMGRSSSALGASCHLSLC